MSAVRQSVTDALAAVQGPASRTPWAVHDARELTRGIKSGAVGVLRGDGPVHVTASCVVFSPDFHSVLLHFHRKAQWWLQFGGHLEVQDSSPRAAATREALEESGLPSLDWVSDSLVEVHRHALGQRFGACTEHIDLVYAAVAEVHQDTTVSAESEAVAWWPVDSLPRGAAPDLPPRIGIIADRGQQLFRD